jgi:BspA type Leucine rich repeat region (6 copies)
VKAKAKKLLSLLMLFALPVAVQAQFTFTTNADNTLTIAGYTGTDPVVTLPDTTNGMAVTSIGSTAFQYNNLTSVTIPDSVISIGIGAFYSCTNLMSITLPNSVTSIGNAAFYHCASLTCVTIPNSVTNFGSGMFQSCTSLTNATIGSGVTTTIGSDAFYNCTSLAMIVVDTNNPAYSSFEGVLFNKSQTKLIQCPWAKAGSYTMPNGVTNVGSYAFEYCTQLVSINIGNSVTSIGDFAFYYCRAMTNVTIGNSVTNIGRYGFYYCTSLTNVLIPSSVTNIADGAFAACPGLKTVLFQGNTPNLGGSSVFLGDNHATVYYLPGTAGWSNLSKDRQRQTMFGGCPAFLWNPQAQTGDGSFGVQSNQFGFNLTGSSNLVLVVEGSTDLANWSPLSTNTLNTFVGTNGTSYFSDPQWTNYPRRFYRLRSP